MNTIFMKKTIIFSLLCILYTSSARAQYVDIEFKDGTNKKIKWEDLMTIDMNDKEYIVVKNLNQRVFEMKSSEVSTIHYIPAKYSKPGDVNEDEKVDISDVVAVINVIAGKDYHVTVPDDDEFPWGSCPDTHHPHAIDMGKAGVWSCCNVGASSPLERGSFYAWGETEVKDDYTLDTYLYGRKDSDGNPAYDELLTDISGSQYDVAHVKWGGSWVMPSSRDFKQLRNNCIMKTVIINGVGGIKFTYINDSPQYEERSIFFPVVGSIYEKTNWLDYKPLYYETGYYVNYPSLYWLSDIRTETDFGDHFSSPIPAAIWDNSPSSWEERYYGCAVRPIMK